MFYIFGNHAKQFCTSSNCHTRGLSGRTFSTMEDGWEVQRGWCPQLGANPTKICCDLGREVDGGHDGNRSIDASWSIWERRFRGGDQ